MTKEVEESIGLWAHCTDYQTRLFPVGETRTTLETLIQADRERWEGWEDLAEMVLSRRGVWRPGEGVEKTTAQIFAEYEDELRKKKAVWPHWFALWRRFAGFFPQVMDLRRPPQIRLSFGNGQTGLECAWSNHRSCRVMVLDLKGVKHIGVMLKAGWWAWPIFEGFCAADEEANRWALLGEGALRWTPICAQTLETLVARHQFCLFRLEENPIWDAVLSASNAEEVFARLTRRLTFWCEASAEGGEAPRFSMGWQVVYNPKMKRFPFSAQDRPRIVESLRERCVPWAERPCQTPQEVAEKDGYICLSDDVSDEERLKVAAQLGYITFPDRPIDAPGGLLRGYQLQGRLLVHAKGEGIRGDNLAFALKRANEIRAELSQTRRETVLAVLCERTCKVICARNALTMEAAREQLERVGYRAVLTRVAEGLGLLTGNKLALFTTGALTLPDLSLALMFERLLGLQGLSWTPKRLVQTTRIRPLEESRNDRRDVFTRHYALVRLSCERENRAKRGGWVKKGLWLARRGETWLVIAAQRDDNTNYKTARFSGTGEEIKAIRFVSEKMRARTDMKVEVTAFDYERLMNLAALNRIGVWQVDPGHDAVLFRDVFSEANEAPAAVVAKPTLEGERLALTFTVGARFKRDGRKIQGREINAYLTAWPEDSALPRVGSLQEVIARDGVWVVPKDALAEVLEAAQYVVTDNGLKGYQLWDRIFWDDGKGLKRAARASIKTFAEKYGFKDEMIEVFRKKILAEAPDLTGWEETLKREFGRIVATGTMSWRQQLVRPAHEFALAVNAVSGGAPRG